jgi:hypothetical protein
MSLAPVTPQVSFGLRTLTPNPVVMRLLTPNPDIDLSITGQTWVPLFETVIQAAQDVRNRSSRAIYPRWIITGPGLYPIFTNTTTGKTWALDYEIRRNHTLTIDFLPTRQTVIDSEDGDVSARIVAGSEFWSLTPGHNAITVDLGGTLPETQIELIRTPG